MGHTFSGREYTEGEKVSCNFACNNSHFSQLSCYLINTTYNNNYKKKDRDKKLVVVNKLSYGFCSETHIGRIIGNGKVLSTQHEICFKK